jgi:hypothetical protein
LGADATVIRRLLGAGGWRRARRGVYRDTGFAARRLPLAAVAQHARCAGLVAALGSGVVVSHLTAARLLGLPLPPGARSEVILTRRPPARSNRVGPATRVHVADYADADVREVQGVPVLAGARLVLDCCSALSPPDALAVADAALRRNLVAGAELRAALQERRRRPGVRTAALVVGRADPLAESWLESVSRWWLAESGLPRPVLQQRFVDDRGFVRARVDFWFPEQGVVGEADGEGKYTEPAALYAEKMREDWLRDRHRVEVVRWVTDEMMDPRSRTAVVDRLRRAIDRRVRPPPGTAASLPGWPRPIRAASPGSAVAGLRRHRRRWWPVRWTSRRAIVRRVRPPPGSCGVVPVSCRRPGRTQLPARAPAA